MSKPLPKNYSREFSGAVKRPGFVLIPSMGAPNMPDFEDIKNALEDQGINVLTPDLSKRGAIQQLPWKQIGSVDLSNMRGCLTSFDRYRGILDQLYCCIVEQETDGRFIKVFPDFDAIQWISSKATYLQYYQKNNISIIPTKALCCLKEPEKASIIAQPDNFDHMFEEIFKFKEKAQTNHFALKPSTSSLGRGLIYIDHTPEKDIYTVSIPREENQTPCRVDYHGYETLENYLMTYFTNTESPDHHFLLQEYVPNIETSAVFINGTPHFIERTQGKNSHIAHARYGGTDRFVENPDRDLIDFVINVMRVSPSDIQDSPFLRIDAMKNTETNQYILSEIEGAGATRLWLSLAGKSNDYANMVTNKLNREHYNHYELRPLERAHPEAA